MNITELDSYNLADAVKFHNRLNPRIWGKDEHLLPDVRQKLLEIAADFQEFLGIDDLAVEDITLSGSNAAYSYTPHSDIDLHLVVRMPKDADDVYQELFNAKKYQYNDLMDIKIHGADVELYVQPADDTPVSLGEYSIKNNQWLQVPRRKRAKIDHSVVKHKYEDLKERIESALKEDDSDRVQALIDKIKAMRQSGLDAHGEFGPENLAFKMLRSQGYIKKLYDHRAAVRAHELSLKEQNKPRERFRWGFSEGHQGSSYSSEDGVSPGTHMFVSEDSAESVVQKFIQDTAQRLGIENMPKIELHSDDNWSVEHHSFGMYVPETHTLHVNLNDRHLLDILRTTAHELAHCRQNELAKLPDDAGKTGSPWEDEAHAIAGVIMRDFADANPEMFKEKPVTEATGYIPKNKREAQDPRFKMAITVDVKPGQVGKEANKLALHTGRNGEPALLMKSVNQLEESLRRELALFENQDLFEVSMKPSVLRREAAKTGAQAGMEFEMIVPDVGGVDLEPEYERDDDQDRRARSFDDIEEFFYDGDYNGRGDVRSLLNELGEAYMEWKMDRTANDWDNEGLDYLRDYIENNDLFDRDEALEIARDEFADANPDIPLDSEEAQRGISARVAELEDQFVQDEFESQGRIYNDAFTEFADEKNQDYEESDFLEEAFPYMSDIERNFDIQWPYYYDINDGQSGEANVDEVADEFSDAIGKPVNASSSYHGARREPGHYVVEPDGSLEGEDPGDAGLEFVSPPLPIDELLSDLNKVKEWAGSRGCYTNDSTGLHINISVPDYSLEKLDYVKLALLMGDEYVLELFGRSGNHYAKAATGKIRTALQKNPDLAPALLDKMRGHMEDLATKAIHSGITDKYTSINTKTGYIEFRSPGGDWLDANFDKIENTLLRFTVALSAAIDPQAYRQEYLKKLYKLLEGAQDKGGVDVVQLFSNYSAGELDKAALIRQVREKQLARNLAKGRTPPGQKYWWSVTNPANTFASIEVVATSKEEAIEKAVEPGNYPEWARVQNTLRAKPLRPYQEPTKSQQVAQQQSSGPTLNGRPSNPGGNYIIYNAENPGNMIPAYRFMAADQNDALVVLGQWRRANPGVWDVAQDTHQSAGQPAAQQQTPSQSEGNWGFWITSLGRFARAPGQSDNNVLRRFPSREAAEQYRANTPGIRSDIEIREIPVAGSTMDRAMQRAAVAQNANYEIYDTRTGSRVEAFHAASNAAALSHLEDYQAQGPHNLSPNDAWARYRVRPIDDTPAFVDTTTQSNRGDLMPRGPGPWEIYQLSNNQAVRPLEHTSRPAAEQEARSALGLRGWDPTEYGVRTRQQQPAQPQQQTFTGQWDVVMGGEVVFRVPGENQSIANQAARQWILGRSPEFLRAHQGQEVEVVPRYA